jgi:group I intron endonuclease
MCKISGIYKITNLINNKIYIGKSYDIEKRSSNHWHNRNSKKYKSLSLYRAFKKYGLINFKFEIIELIERDVKKKLNTELNRKEKYYIKKFKSFGKEGYNQTKGGDGTLGSIKPDKIKELIRKANSGINNHFAVRIICLNNLEIFGCIKYAENKYKTSSVNIVKCCKGKYLSSGKNKKGEKLVWVYYEDYLKMNELDIKNKIEKAQNYGKGEYNYQSRKIICLNTMKIFNTLIEISIKYHIAPSGISNCCRNKIKSYGKDTDGNKLHWMYYDDYLNKERI